MRPHVFSRDCRSSSRPSNEWVLLCPTRLPAPDYCLHFVNLGVRFDVLICISLTTSKVASLFAGNLYFFLFKLPFHILSLSLPLSAIFFFLFLLICRSPLLRQPINPLPYVLQILSPIYSFNFVCDKIWLPKNFKLCVAT